MKTKQEQDDEINQWVEDKLGVPKHLNKEQKVMKKVLLTKEDFEKLVAGQIVEIDGVQIALQDIGLHVMHEAILDQIRKLWEKEKET